MWQFIINHRIINSHYQLIYLLISMDDISQWLQGLCCLLPFLAFILLIKQMYGGGQLRKKLNTPFISSHLETIHNQDIAIIMNQIHQKPLHNQVAKDNSLSNSHINTHSYQSSSCQQQLQQKSLSHNNGVLSRCNAGIARIDFINKKYLSYNNIGSIEIYLQQMKRNRNRLKKNKKEIFQSTFLPPIIECLQY